MNMLTNDATIILTRDAQRCPVCRHKVLMFQSGVTAPSAEANYQCRDCGFETTVDLYPPALPPWPKIFVPLPHRINGWVRKVW